MGGNMATGYDAEYLENEFDVKVASILCLFNGKSVVSAMY